MQSWKNGVSGYLEVPHNIETTLGSVRTYAQQLQDILRPQRDSTLSKSWKEVRYNSETAPVQNKHITRIMLITFSLAPRITLFSQIT